MALKLSLAELNALNTAGARKALNDYQQACRKKPASRRQKKPAEGKKQPTALEVSFYEQITNSGLPEPLWGDKEHRFHPERRWRFDFAWPDYKLAVELEGGTYSHGKQKDGKQLKSRHLTPTGFYNDCHKYAEAAILGWLVIRADAKMVKNQEALRLTARAIQFRKTSYN